MLLIVYYCLLKSFNLQSIFSKFVVSTLLLEDWLCLKFVIAADALTLAVDTFELWLAAIVTNSVSLLATVSLSLQNPLDSSSFSFLELQKNTVHNLAKYWENFFVGKSYKISNKNSYKKNPDLQVYIYICLPQ